MLDFLTGRLKQRQQQRAALIDQEAQQFQRKAHVREMVRLLKDLLKDTRYEAYTQLLHETQQSLLAEREALLQHETDAEAREHQVAVLTGRLMQLEHILITPEQFFSLAESVEANGNAARPQARELVR